MVQVKQEELERHDGVPSGKYTVGLGQVRTNAAICPDQQPGLVLGMHVCRAWQPADICRGTRWGLGMIDLVAAQAC